MMHIDWQAFLLNYGYLAILLGTFFEGESILVMGGYAAHEGYLSMPFVLLVAFAGSFFGDQLYFLIGRRYGQKFLLKRPVWQARVARVDKLLRRYQTLYILGFRFLYGLRTITPFVLGSGDVRTSVFILLNATGAMLWTLSVGFVGYAFGEVVSRYLRFAKDYEAQFGGGIFCVALVGAIVLHNRAKRRSQKQFAASGTPLRPSKAPPAEQISQ